MTELLLGVPFSSRSCCVAPRTPPRSHAFNLEGGDNGNIFLSNRVVRGGLRPWQGFASTRIGLKDGLGLRLRGAQFRRKQCGAVGLDYGRHCPRPGSLGIPAKRVQNFQPRQCAFEAAGLGHGFNCWECGECGCKKPRRNWSCQSCGGKGLSCCSGCPSRCGFRPRLSRARKGRPGLVHAFDSDDSEEDLDKSANLRNSWLRRFLFDRIETGDIPGVETGDSPGVESEVVENGRPRRRRGRRQELVDLEDLEEDIDELDFSFLETRLDDDEEDELVEDEIDALIEDDVRFARWQRKNEARNELREFQATGRDPDSKDWEDWLDDSWGHYDENLDGQEGWYQPAPDWEKHGVPREPPSKPERGMKRTIKELFFRIFEREEEVADDLQFEERVFRFTSQTTAKFVGVLIIIPWITDFVIHDYMIVPFLNTYVEKVPLAAKVLDIRESQKLRMIEQLKLERQRVRFEAEIGKAPPLSDDELSEHLREEALEMREEMRLENRQAFANIWSDFVAGSTTFLLLVLNPQKVAIMRLTGERLFTNISDTGKAFIIILLTDIFLGYHSESGWETVSEMVLEHYGFEVSQAAIYIFVAIVPVTFDACFKLWVFRFFRTLSPSASATFREMQRH